METVCANDDTRLNYLSVFQRYRGRVGVLQKQGKLAK